MKTARIFTYAALAIAALAPGAISARAQAIPIAPIVVKTLNTLSGKPAQKGDWLKAEVIHMDSNSMVVREQANGLMIHTFTYSVEMRDAIQKFMDNGGYQYGDKVKILYQPGQTVALRIQGKPSKPL